MARFDARIRASQPQPTFKTRPGSPADEARPAMPDCLLNRQIAQNPRGCCAVRYQFRKNLLITRLSGGVLKPESGPISGNRKAAPGRKKALCGLFPGFRLGGLELLIKQANRPKPAWMLRSALSIQEKSVDNLPASGVCRRAGGGVTGRWPVAAGGLVRGPVFRRLRGLCVRGALARGVWPGRGFLPG